MPTAPSPTITHLTFCIIDMAAHARAEAQRRSRDAFCLMGKQILVNARADHRHIRPDAQFGSVQLWERGASVKLFILKILGLTSFFSNEISRVESPNKCVEV